MPGNLSPSSSSVAALATAGDAGSKHQLAGSFASLEERIAHLQWRKVCNERQIQGSLRLTKQLQERDEFRRAAKQSGTAKHKAAWVEGVIAEELHKPLPVTPLFLSQLTEQERELERAREDATRRHMTQIKQIQSRLDARESQLVRKREFDRKKKELLSGGSINIVNE